MPLVTLIIPVYNAARYLRRCLDSVLEQDFADMEVLVLNDGSRDRSLEICREYDVTMKRETAVSGLSTRKIQAYRIPGIGACGWRKENTFSSWTAMTG